MSHVNPPTLVSAVLEAQSDVQVTLLLSQWYETVKNEPGMERAIGLDFYIKQREWGKARATIERTFGSSDPHQKSKIDVLEAAEFMMRISRDR